MISLMSAKVLVRCSTCSCCELSANKFLVSWSYSSNQSMLLFDCTRNALMSISLADLNLLILEDVKLSSGRFEW